MRLREQFFTENDCALLGRYIAVQGVMIHSTGANNPRVSRYVRGNAEIGRNNGNNHWDKPGLEKCVHAFIGQFADDKVGTVQTLPWTQRAWHCGGAGNGTHIGIEICEDCLDDKMYLEAVYREAVEVTAMLCQEFHLDPLKDGVILCHAEGHTAGIASNHADVLHWWPKHGKSMDDFRTDVKKELQKEEPMTQEQFNSMMDEWLVKQSKKNASAWSSDLIEKATALGITDGNRPQSFATREEVATMILGALKLGGLK